MHYKQHTIQGDKSPKVDKNPTVIPRKCSRRKQGKSGFNCIYFMMYCKRIKSDIDGELFSIIEITTVYVCTANEIRHW